jgi:hypothetical protein
MTALMHCLRSWILPLHEGVRFAVEASMDLKALEVCPSLHASIAHFPGLSDNDQQIGHRRKTIRDVW